MDIKLFINGTEYNVNSREVGVNTTLNTFIRQHAQLTGTKYMCNEGGCGACVVTITRLNPATRQNESFAVNSCLKSLYACDGYHVTTIEGLGNAHTGYHPLQRRTVKLNGSQCGYCTGGMLMNMYGLMAQNADNALTMRQIEHSFGGNICRCTGYRPLLDTFKSFASDASEALVRRCQDPDLADWDIEDLSAHCPKSGAPCAGQCQAAGDRNLLANEPMGVVFAGADTWYRAMRLQDVFDAWRRIAAGTPYMLVAGNTARGITRLSPDLHTFIDINPIAELYATQQTPQFLSVGALNSLTEFTRVLRAATRTPGFEYCADLADHVELIANNPVRNVGSIAGNLCYKHAHHEYPSDVFLMLDTCDASLAICDVGNVRTVCRMGQFLKMSLDRRLVYSVTLPKLEENAAFRTYKVMIRAQNAHAYVNAGFYVRQAAGKVTYARICYGGIAPEFAHATQTEQLLIGRDLYTNETLQAALASLSAELQPDWVLPDAQPAYRKTLAMALFYRFVLRTAPARKLSEMNRSGSTSIERPLSSGTQTFDVYKENFPLTEPLEKYEGLEQTSGEAKYVNDMPPIKGEVWAALVYAKKVHAKVAGIDATAALAVPGVVSFHTLADMPGTNDFTMPTVFTVFPEPIMVGVGEDILYNGQPCGVLCATDQLVAHAAAKLVKVTYMASVAGAEDGKDSSNVYSFARSFLSPLIGAPPEKPIAATLQAALELNDPKRTHHHKSVVATRRGVNGTQSLSGRFVVGGQFHYAMETQTCVCEPAEKGLNVYSSTQWIELTQMCVASMLNIHEHEVNMRVLRLGGGFGVKISRATQFACLTALPCYLLKRPVRLVLPLEEHMQSVGKRFGLSADYDLQIDDLGAIQSMKIDFTQDSGCSFNEAVNGITIATIPNVYNTAAWSMDGRVVLTDSPSNTFMRCPGTLEGIATIENIMDNIRWKTRRDELEVRLANMAPDHPWRPMSAQFVQETDYYARKAAVDAFNAANKWRKQGIALIPMQWPLVFYGVLSAYIAVYHHDGSVVVKHGGIEMGQGINTKVAQVVAHTLGVPMELVSVKYTDNISTANSVVTGGSVTTESACYAVKITCDRLLARMKGVRDTLAPGHTWPELTHACHLKEIDLREMYQFKTTDLPPYNIYGITSSVVEVDIMTGCYQLKSVHLYEDVGQSINPKLDIGQVEGAFVMGLGYWLSEQLIYDGQTGELLTNRTWTYKPPGALDIPVDFNVKFVRNSPNPTEGFLRSKAVGEPATAMSFVAVLALRYAINAFREANGRTDLWFQLGSGTTPEEVFMQCGVDPAAFLL